MSSPSTPLTFIETTALTIAHRRSLENARPDRLFEDPFAAAFVKAAGEVGRVASELPSSPADYFAIRTRFFDDFLLEATSRGCRQVVVLGAGLDARAYRLAWPEGVRLFELDLAPTLRFKEEVTADLSAAPRCERIAVSVDLRHDWEPALRAAGFTDAPTAWLVEGFLFFLDESDGRRLVEKIAGASPAGSELGLEHVNAATLAALAPIMSALAERGAPWRSSVEDPAAWLRPLGWDATVVDHEEAGARLGRPLAFPSSGPPPRAWLVRALRELPRSP